ncbi:Uncharacterised protein [Vibrio cholerae]|nr:Uncharacterised protein [Vibrio cholerae]
MTSPTASDSQPIPFGTITSNGAPWVLSFAPRVAIDMPIATSPIPA